MRFSPDDLNALAAEALHEVCREAEDRQLARSKLLKFLLAYVVSQTGERASANNLWREATRTIQGGGANAADFGRRQTINGAAKYLIRQMGFEPPG